MPLLALAVGCSKEDIVPAAESVTRFTLRVCPEETQAVTRAADERAVKDMNVFLFDPQGIRPSQHFYVQGGVLERSIPAGRYDVYAVANLHEDMGPMSREALSDYEFRVPRSYTSLPMSGYAECTVGKGTPEATVTVRRNVAKIACNISFYGVDYDLKLQSVQVVDMASVTTLFAEDQQARELTSSELSAIASYENRKASRTFFLAENCRGEVPGITSQEQKCAGNAPEGATFLRIKAQREGKLLTYDVYLGENNTTNFDVRRNTVYTLNIVIKDENAVDTRVEIRPEVVQRRVRIGIVVQKQFLLGIVAVVVAQVVLQVEGIEPVPAVERQVGQRCVNADQCFLNALLVLVRGFRRYETRSLDVEEIAGAQRYACDEYKK